MEIVYNTAPDDLDVESRNREIRNMLHNGVCEITFTKVDGSVRVMPCTLNESLIPPAPVHVTNTDNPVDFPAPKREKKINPDVMSVWCTDKNEWRSFRVANVQRVIRK
jgi:hypothetical protein